MHPAAGMPCLLCMARGNACRPTIAATTAPGKERDGQGVVAIQYLMRSGNANHLVAVGRRDLQGGNESQPDVKGTNPQAAAAAGKPDA